MHLKRTLSLLAVAAVSVGITGGVGDSGPSAHAAVGASAGGPGPLVTGPITAGGGIFDLQGDVSQLPVNNYIQEEFFFEGTAQAYNSNTPLTTDGHWAAVPTTTAAYKTRMVVRRPLGRPQFNGIAVVEWYNVTAGFDNGPDWSFAREELLRRGFIWVGISAQYVGVEGGVGSLGFGGLKATDPVRYGSLVHPGDDYSYDIYTQAGMALRNPNGVDPLGGIRPEKLIATGESQSASRMTTYVNAVSPLNDVYTSFLIHSRSARSSALNTTGNGATPTPVFIRTDQHEPVIQLEAETDVPGFAAARQPDNGHLRTWEVAGTSHVDEYGLGPLAIAFLNCPLPVNSGPHHYIAHTAFRELLRWMRDPSRDVPHGAQINLDASNGVIRDQYGNATGGIRTPQLDVPIATLSGFGQSGGFCGLFGTTLKFTDAQLLAAHHDRGNFLRTYVARTRAMRASGFLLGPDVWSVLGEAAMVPFPQA